MGKHKIAFGISVKKLFGSALLLFATVSVSAQTVQTFFVDNIDLPYLTTAQKQQLVDDFKDKKGDALVVNSLGDTTLLESSTANFIQLKCNNAHTIQIKSLRRQSDNDNVFCVVNTYKAPAAESTIEFFTKDNVKINEQLFTMPQVSSLLQKPDTLSNDDFKQLTEMFDPQLIELRLSPTDNSITETLSLPSVPRDKKKILNGLRLQRKLNWNGNNFN